MKLPFDFSLKFVFRILLPGFVLSLGIMPIIQTVLDYLKVNIPTDYAFLLSVIVFGWLYPILDMHLYILYEGRRYWPNKIWNFCVGRQKRRLEKLLKEHEEYKRRKENKKEIEGTEYAKYLERSVELRRFPMDDSGQYYAKMPTRLGNLLASYEGYPLRIYGMDSYFYWYRIWLALDSEMQEQIDNQQAIDVTILKCHTLLLF